MTDSRRSLPPQIATSTHATSYTPPSLLPPLDASIITAENVSDEDYTIKCICEYTDDDGSTIYCESCLTWQHIQCYYPGIVNAASDDFDHLCIDCKPRPLDGRQAAERQKLRRLRESVDLGDDRKTKRPPSKSHKKKPKATSDALTNGHRHETDSTHAHKNCSPQEQPSTTTTSHTKKTKSGHRSHQSISSHRAKRSPSYSHHTNQKQHPLSPANTPPDLPDDFHTHGYSDHFVQLYNNDPGAMDLKGNSYASLAVPSIMSLWLRDPERLREDCGVTDKDEVFQMIKDNVDLSAHPWPQLVVRSSSDDPDNETGIRCRYLTVARPVPASEGLVGELKGSIGFQKDYYMSDTEAYTRTCHPAPFVFFHPRLPIYVDTRREGSKCRYVRRSCRPNTSLEIYITLGFEYRFCITADRSLAEGEQITLPWDFRFKAEVRDRYLHLLGLSDEDITDEPDHASAEEYNELSDLIYDVLSDYGGCACGLKADCAFVRFHRNYHAKAHNHSTTTAKVKRGRKPKQHVSPNSTGQATNSRAPSEGQDAHEGDEDNKSTSGSTRSKPQSRDMTPLAAATIEAPEVSEREKRKIAKLEEGIARSEQPPKKKKRTSDGTNGVNGVSATGTSSAKKSKSSARSGSNATSIVPGNRSRQYVDASTSRVSSGSPSTEVSPVLPLHSPMARQPEQKLVTHHSPSESRPIRRSSYVDIATQTDDVPNAWWAKSKNPPKTYLPLRQRLLQDRWRVKCEREAAREKEASAKATEATTPSVITPLGLEASHDIGFLPDVEAPSVSEIEGNEPVDNVEPPAAALSAESATDTVMQDASGEVVENKIKSPPPPWPTSTTPKPEHSRSPELRIQMPGPATFLNSSQQPLGSSASGSLTLSSAAALGPSSSAQVLSALSPSLQRSMAAITVLSPIKTPKKLSLSDYRARLKKAPEQNTASQQQQQHQQQQASAEDSPTDTPAAATTLLQSSNSSLPLVEAITNGSSGGVLEGSAIVESPVREKGGDTMVTATVTTADADDIKPTVANEAI